MVCYRAQLPVVPFELRERLLFEAEAVALRSMKGQAVRRFHQRGISPLVESVGRLAPTCTAAVVKENRGRCELAGGRPTLNARARRGGR